MRIARTLAYLSLPAPHLVSRPSAPLYSELVRPHRTRARSGLPGGDGEPSRGVRPILDFAAARRARAQGSAGTRGGLAG